MAAKSKEGSYIYATGRRKSSSARIRLFKSKGDNVVNGKKFEDYFAGKLNTARWSLPFRLTETLEKYHVTVKVVGGGMKGQLDAVTHGIAKALSLTDREKYRSPLKVAGLLTRDARERERRKVNTGGKARRQKQSPKR